MNVLDRILAKKEHEVRASLAHRAMSDWQRLAEEAPPSLDFEAALRQPGRMRVIAEIKKASPSKGVLRADFDPLAIARSYDRNGADCLSVLTDESFFQGSLAYLASVTADVHRPALRKDFVIDPVQVLEARHAGASAVLLIAECLSAARMKELVELTHQWGMSALVELYDADNLPAVLDSGARLVGINNRDLRTFEVSLSRTLDLLDRIPSDRLVISESGIASREDVALLHHAGVRAILVGEAFMRADDPGKRMAELLA